MYGLVFLLNFRYHPQKRDTHFFSILRYFLYLCKVKIEKKTHILLSDKQ